MCNNNRIFDHFSEGFAEDFSNVLSLESLWVVGTVYDERLHFGFVDESWITSMIFCDTVVCLTKDRTNERPIPSSSYEPLSEEFCHHVVIFYIGVVFVEATETTEYESSYHIW